MIVVLQPLQKEQYSLCTSNVENWHHLPLAAPDQWVSLASFYSLVNDTISPHRNMEEHGDAVLSPTYCQGIFRPYVLYREFEDSIMNDCNGKSLFEGVRSAVITGGPSSGEAVAKQWFSRLDNQLGNSVVATSMATIGFHLVIKLS